MQRALIVTGVLGMGTAVVFGLAALTATLFPNGALVRAGWNGPVMMDRVAPGFGPDFVSPNAVPVPGIPAQGAQGIVGTGIASDGQLAQRFGGALPAAPANPLPAGP